MAKRTPWVIVVVDGSVNWRKAPAAGLVREIGVPLTIATRWQEIRRQMSPSGLKKKIKATRN